MKATMRKAAIATAGAAVAGGAIFGATGAFAADGSSTPFSVAAAGASSTAPDHGKAQCKTAKHPKACARRHQAGRDRAALFKHGAHGQSTVKDKQGQYVVDEWQVGKVTQVNGQSVTVTDGSGTTWAWTVQSGAKIHVDGKQGALGGVHVGDTILVRGRQSGGANDATALFDPNQSKLG